MSQAEICARYAAFPDLRQHVADFLKPGMRVPDLGGGYLNFSVPMFKRYLPYEDWVARNNHRNLASHYFVRAVK